MVVGDHKLLERNRYADIASAFAKSELAKPQQTFHVAPKANSSDFEAARRLTKSG
jgi:hypothetical protein